MAQKKTLNWIRCLENIIWTCGILFILFTMYLFIVVISGD